MTTSPLPSADTISVSLDWAVNKFGPQFFDVYGRWGKSEKVFREETRSTLESSSGGWHLGDIAAGVRNLARILKGHDEYKVRVYADELIVRIVPKQRRVVLPRIARIASVVEEVSVPTVGEHQELDIPTFCIRSTRFDKAECEAEIRDLLYPLGLPFPEIDNSFLPEPTTRLDSLPASPSFS